MLGSLLVHRTDRTYAHHVSRHGLLAVAVVGFPVLRSKRKGIIVGKNRIKSFAQQPSWAAGRTWKRRPSSIGRAFGDSLALTARGRRFARWAFGCGRLRTWEAQCPSPDKLNAFNRSSRTIAWRASVLRRSSCCLEVPCASAPSKDATWLILPVVICLC